MPTLMRTLALGLATAASLQVGEALAQDSGPIAAAVRPGATPVRPNPLGLKPVDSKALESKRGGAKTVNEMVLKGVVADTRASDLTTGNNTIADGAFSGSAGLPMVIQNSGNNVLIQNATIVNVQVK